MCLCFIPFWLTKLLIGTLSFCTAGEICIVVYIFNSKNYYWLLIINNYYFILRILLHLYMCQFLCSYYLFAVQPFLLGLCSFFLKVHFLLVLLEQVCYKMSHFLKSENVSICCGSWNIVLLGTILVWQLFLLITLKFIVFIFIWGESFISSSTVHFYQDRSAVSLTDLPRSFHFSPWLLLSLLCLWHSMLLSLCVLM